MTENTIYLDADTVNDSIARLSRAGDDIVDHQFAFREVVPAAFRETEPFDRALHAYGWMASLVARSTATHAHHCAESLSDAADDLIAIDSRAQRLLVELAHQLQAGSDQ
ncbi:hypothetical protein [Agromyces atrinae]|uniref:Uncharacterized protein n=1 Tax=Agromyces atrinae TaxID=592376 RepID=A0A4Q2M8K9_9MICO|nr:hypothetical protein [Agromyces atrinae]NYD66001.1 hypothetical protein [Agromyces atrinae]RXZ86331.1 hypothetical protein ESP50_11275 [Agromyces atrinae]